MPKILIVEDDADLQYLYSAMLARHGYDVVVAANGSSAILNLTNSDFDLMVLDINMPDLSGVQVVQFMHNDVRLQHLPVVVASANEKWRREMFEMGIQHYLIKPVALQDLLALVNKLLKHR